MFTWKDTPPASHPDPQLSVIPHNRTGDGNVYIGSRGENGDENVIRIGDPDTHTRTYLAGEVIGDVNVVPVYQ